MTTYRFDVDCEDLGEYDDMWISQVAGYLARTLRRAGVKGMTVATSRRRDDEEWST